MKNPQQSKKSSYIEFFAEKAKRRTQYTNRIILEEEHRRTRMYHKAKTS